MMCPTSSMNELMVNDILATPAKPAPRHVGVIRISYDLLKQLEIDMKNCNTQGEYQDKGVFAELHKKFLLPDSYTIWGLFLRWPFRDWELVVESPDLPALEWGCEPPDIVPVYRNTYDPVLGLLRGTPTYELVKIKIEDRWQRTYSPEEVTLEQI